MTRRRNAKGCIDRATFRGMRSGKTILLISFTPPFTGEGTLRRFGVFCGAMGHYVIVRIGRTRPRQVHFSDIHEIREVNMDDVVASLNAFERASRYLLPS